MRSPDLCFYIEVQISQHPIQKKNKIFFNIFIHLILHRSGSNFSFNEKGIQTKFLLEMKSDCAMSRAHSEGEQKEHCPFPPPPQFLCVGGGCFITDDFDEEKIISD